MSATAIEQLLKSDEPAVRFLARVQGLGEDPDSRPASRERKLIPQSPRVRTMLSEMRPDGLIPRGTYDKWLGGHWVLAFLSEIGYPPGDKRLAPTANRCANWALGISATLIDGRWRRCASQQSYAVLYLMKLGFYDARCDALVEKLIEWQWPDGGWNCDKHPEASHSSFHESLLPMRALFHYAGVTGNAEALRSARKVAKLFLERKLLRRKSSGEIIDPAFAQLQYPYHWRYNILHGLKAMAEAGLVRDPRCAEALDVLEDKRLGDGGFPCEKREYVVRKKGSKAKSLVDWGPTSVRRMNPWVTLDAMYVLRLAQRYEDQNTNRHESSRIHTNHR
jgi:hypothetical protein